MAGRLGCDEAHAVLQKYIENFKDITLVDVHLADDGVAQALRTGDIVMSMKTEHDVKKGVLTNVWYIPQLSRSFLSVGKFTKGCHASDFRVRRILRR